MKKNHITLVGGQITPVQNGIKYINPDEIIFISSEQSFVDAKKLKDSFDIPTEIIELNSYNLPSIHKKALELYDKYNDCDLSINLTSGTKPWSLVFYDVFSKSNVKFILVEQGEIIWDLQEKTSVKLTSTIEALFVHEMPRSFNKFEDYTEDDKEAVKNICKLKNVNTAMFFALIAEARKKGNLTKFEKKENKLEWIKDEKAYIFTLKNKKTGKLVTRTLKSKNIRRLLIDAGWFEYKVGSIISKLLNVKEVMTNCSFNASNNAPKNEIDIIAHIGNKLLFVECKTQIDKITDIDKFSKAARNFGGLGCKTLFVTNEKKTSIAIEKCKDNDVLDFCLSDYENEEEQVKALSKLLEKEMNTNNAR